MKKSIIMSIFFIMFLSTISVAQERDGYFRAIKDGTTTWHNKNALQYKNWEDEDWLVEMNTDGEFNIIKNGTTTWYRTKSIKAKDWNGRNRIWERKGRGFQYIRDGESEWHYSKFIYVKDWNSENWRAYRKK